MRSVLKAWMASALLCLVAACADGGNSETANEPPQAAVLASGDVRADGGAMVITLGGLLRLDATGSTDADEDTLSYEWSLTTRPAGSTAAFNAATGAVVEWTPDAMGTYVFTLEVTDSHGASATTEATVTVDNHAPAPSLLVTPQFTAEPSVAPTQAVTVGAVVLLDANASTDPDGDALGIAFELTEKPEGSAAALVTTGKSARLTTDAKGLYKIQVNGSDGHGGSFVSIYTFDADNLVPNPVVAASVDAVVAQGGSQTVQASVGYDVVLNSGASADPDGNALTRAWTLKSRPAGSSATLSSSTGQSTGLSPDALGDYVVVLTVTDTHGAKSEYTTTVSANNRRPVASIGTNATPQSLPSAPSVMVPAGTTLTLRGSLSSDADGDALTYLWTVETRPAGSAATLSSATSADPVVTVDVDGRYRFRLRATDGHGAFSERVITVNAGTHSPVAVVDKNRVSVLPGSAVQMSGTMSYDEDGDSITFQWTLDARPAASAATIAGATGTSLNFTPDVAGTYVVALTVRDAGTASVAYVTIRALEQVRTSVELTYTPSDARYSRALDKIVLVGSGAYALHIIDPFTGANQSVSLPAAVRDFQLSPDGKSAIVLHTKRVSLVALDTATLVHSTTLSYDYERALLLNDGVAFLIGTKEAWWAEVDYVDARTGTLLPQSGYVSYYDAAAGVLADKLNRVFMVSTMSSPSDLSYFEFDAADTITDWRDSPYHGTYDMSPPLYLSESQDLVFTGNGDYYRTDSLQHAGALSGMTYSRSMSHSAADGELLVIPFDYSEYPSSYSKYSGGTFAPAGSLAMPTIEGSQAYAMQVFHSAAGAHVILCQTGSAGVGQGTHYYVITR
jgi:hypothetical protein